MHSNVSIYVTEFWKITHMGAREIIRIFMFSGLLIRAGNSFENMFKVLRMAVIHQQVDLHYKVCG